MNTTVYISPSPQIGNEINFNPLDRGDLVFKHQQIPSSPDIPEQAQRGSKPNFFALFAHISSLPSKKSVDDRMRKGMIFILNLNPTRLSF